MANIFSVSNSEELMNALASASGGDTIELAGGDYGKLSLNDAKAGFDFKFEEAVTIRSVDADQPASFSGMDLRGVSNLTFDGLVFDYDFSQDDPLFIRPFQIGYGSSDITIKNSIFDGDVASGVSEIDDGYGYGTGLSVRDSSNISVDNNEFLNWYRGAVFAQTDGLSVTQNEVHSIRSDGFNFVEVTSVLIEGNYIHDFKASPLSSDHRDMIQFWTTGTDSPTTDVIIRDNVLDIGEGSWTQSIFMRNEQVDKGLAGQEMYYQNILIENNTIYNAHTRGITLGETDNLIIRDNVVLQAEGGELHGLTGNVTVPKIYVASVSTSVSVENNVVHSFIGYDNQSDWTVLSNSLATPTDEATEDSPTGEATEDSVVSSEDNVGSGETLTSDTTDSTTSSGDGEDARASTDPVSEETPNSSESETTTSSETDEVTDDIPTNQETVPEEDSGTLDPLLLGGYSLELAEISSDTSVQLHDDAHIVDKQDGQAISFDGKKDYVSLGRLPEFESSQKIAFSVDFSNGSDDGTVRKLVSNHSKLGLAVEGDGIRVLVANNDDEFWQGFKIEGLGLNDGDQHSATVMVDAETDRLQVVVDDVLVLEEQNTDFDFVGAGGYEWGWTLGTPWNRWFEGEVYDFQVSNDFDFIDVVAEDTTILA